MTIPVMPQIIRPSSALGKQYLADHWAWVAQHGTRVSFSAAEEARLRVWAERCRGRKRAPSSDGTWDGASFEERNYKGIKGAYAVTRLLGGVCDFDLYDHEGPDWDVLIGHQFFEVKSRQAWLALNIIRPTIDGSPSPQFPKHQVVLVNPGEVSSAVIVCGSITRTAFIAQMFLTNLGYGPRFAVTASALEKLI